MVHGGERGIRTLGPAFGGTHDFQSCPFGQLGHLSVFFMSFESQIFAIIFSGAGNYVESTAAMNLAWFMAERVGFEPT
jgi:hypothetical protein